MVGVISSESVAPTAVEHILTHTLVLPHNSLVKLCGIVKIIDLPKGHLLFSADKLERDIYFNPKPHQGGNQVVFYHL